MAIRNRPQQRAPFGLARVGESNEVSPLISRDLISLNPIFIPTSGQPGETLTAQFELINHANPSEIDSGDEHFCSVGGTPGADVVVGGAIAGGTQLNDQAICIPASGQQVVDVDLPLPNQPGSYNASVGAFGPVGAPELFDSNVFGVTVIDPGGGNGDNGGNGDPPPNGDDEETIFGFPRDEALIGVGIAAVTIGAAARYFG